MFGVALDSTIHWETRNQTETSIQFQLPTSNSNELLWFAGVATIAIGLCVISGCMGGQCKCPTRYLDLLSVNRQAQTTRLKLAATTMHFCLG